MEIATHPRMTYADAMRRYGSTSPTCGSASELTECTEFFADTPFRVFRPRTWVPSSCRRCLAAPSAARRLAGVGQAARAKGSGVHPGAGGRFARRSGRQNLSDAERVPASSSTWARRRATASSSPPDRSKGTAGVARCRARRDRLAAGPDQGRRLGVHLGRRRPLFEARRRGDRLRRRGRRLRCVDRGASRVHLAQAESLELLDTDPGAALAYAYDIVCSGTRSAAARSVSTGATSGEKVFAMMGISHDEAQEKFGFLLDAFAYGAPPRTAASPSAGTGSPHCSPARARSARSSPSRSPVAASTRSPTPRRRSPRSSARSPVSTPSPRCVPIQQATAAE